MKTRQELIDSGKIWQVYYDVDHGGILYEGNKTSCKKYIKDNKLNKKLKSGFIRLGKVIMEY